MENYNLAFYINRTTNKLEFYKVYEKNTDILNCLTTQPVIDSTVLILSLPVGRLYIEDDINEEQVRLISKAEDIYDSVLTPIDYLNKVLLIVLSNGNTAFLRSEVNCLNNLKHWYYREIDETYLIKEN